MNKVTRIGLIIALLVACVGCDQVSKHVVRNYVDLEHTQSFLGDTFRLTHTENPGAFLSAGAGLSPELRFAVFQVGVGILVLGLLAYALFSRRLSTWGVAAITLVAASGIGNLIDRLMNDGRVTDFLNVGFGSLRTGIFNVADMVGVAGVLVLLLAGGRASTTTSEAGKNRQGS